MASRFQQNTIVTGHINSICLVCERHFDTMEATNNHIDDEEHVKRLSAHPYLDKYQGDHIRKVNKGYFCEFCSLILTGAVRVNLHIAQRSHFTNKGNFLLKRVGTAIIAFDDILINEKAWHSFADETCAVCSMEFENESIHKTESGHLLKLVLLKVEFGANNSVYRKIDDSFFQCLTCNAVCALETIEDHFNDADHTKLYAQCQDEMKKYCEQNKLADISSPKKKTDAKNSKDSTETKVENSTCNTQKVPSKVDENQNNTALAEAIPKPNKTKTVVPKISKNTKSDKAIESKNPKDTQSSDETTIYAKENNLTYNPGNSNAFCRLCATKVPSTLRSMKEHVTGKEHKMKMAKAAEAAAEKLKPNITRRPMHKFIVDCVHIENHFSQDAVINNKICVTNISYMMVTKTGGRYRCQCCEVYMYGDNIDMDSYHMSSDRHERAMKDTPVITSLDSEFVREVRPNIYHCGFCNFVMGEWSAVDAHLKSRQHAEQRTQCQWRLQQHLPGIAEHKRQQEHDMFKLYLMYNHGINFM